MALCKLERRNCGGKWPVSIKYQNLSILEIRGMTHLHGSAHFTIPLSNFGNKCIDEYFGTILGKNNK